MQKKDPTKGRVFSKLRNKIIKNKQMIGLLGNYLYQNI